jgi:hypothetical protein
MRFEDQVLRPQEVHRIRPSKQVYVVYERH